MPQNGQAESGTVCIYAENGCSDAAKYSAQCVRRDIWLGMVPDADAARVSLYAESVEPVLVIAFLVPRTGKGGEDRLPEGFLRMLPPGKNLLPELPGRGLLLCITAGRLASILGPDMATLPDRVRLLLQRKGEGAEPIQVTLTPEQVLAGNALIHCPYEGAVRNMFFKSKVLELLALFFGQVALREQAGNTVRLSLSDQEIVGRAREFLLRHMEEPPGVSQLARHVGVNDTKLKRLFREAYGLSPYAYLRMERMTAAREMLLAKGANVSEAAMSVGYSNVSHFIDAFTRHYGIRPGELRTRGWRANDMGTARTGG